MATTMTREDMSARYVTDAMRKAAKKVPQFIVSADGHVDAPPDMFKELPREIFDDHMWLTFMDDEVGGRMLRHWGDRKCMWSSDYPHPNMTWPNSRAFIARRLGDLDAEKQKLVLSQNRIDLYGLDIKI